MNTIEAIRNCIADGTCIKCPHFRKTACRHFMLADALRMIEKQAEEIKKYKEGARNGHS